MFVLGPEFHTGYSQRVGTEQLQEMEPSWNTGEITFFTGYEITIPWFLEVTEPLKSLKIGTWKHVLLIFQAVIHFGWALSVSTMRALSNYNSQIADEDELIIDSALDLKVFKKEWSGRKRDNFWQFLFLQVFHFLEEFVLNNELAHKEEFYLRRFHQLITDFIGNKFA